MERDNDTVDPNTYTDNFNSHAHVERDNITFDVTTKHTISTHTLTWSVTHDVKILHYFILDFNSHAHVERDFNMKRERLNTAISTHTLTWSVTRIIC